MKNRTYIVLLLIFFYSLSFGKSKESITVFAGSIVDSSLNTSLNNIRVEILETGDTAISNTNGEFVFNGLDDSEYIFVFSNNVKKKIFKTVELKWLNKRKPIHLLFKLNFPIKSDILDSIIVINKESILDDSSSKNKNSEIELSDIKDESKEQNWMSKLTVKGRKLKKSGLGKQTISKQAIKKMPGLAEPDVMRAVQMLPGVVASSDFSNKLYVRGGSSDQNLILLDGSVVYSPSHFGGFFSTFNVDALKDMEFYKGGFPVAFGNRLSSVLDVSQRNGKDGWAHGGLGVSLLSGKAYYECGIPEIGSFLWTYRRTWIDQALSAAKDAGIMDFELPYYFYDSQGKLSLNITPNDTISFSGYFGDDILDFGKLLGVNWGNKVFGSNLSHRVNNKLLLNTHLSYSNFTQQVSLLDSSILLDNQIDEINFKIEGFLKYSKDIKLNAGLEMNNFDVLFVQDFNLLMLDTLLGDTSESMLFAGFIDSKVQLLEYLFLRPGLRLSYYTATNDFALDPRLDFELELLPTLNLMGHIGNYSQFLTSITFGDVEMPTEYWYAIQGDMQAAKSTLFSLGLKSQLTRTITSSVEAYYKTFDNLPIFNQNTSPGDTATTEFYEFFHTSEGYAFGFEFLIEKRLGFLNGYASYSLGYSIAKEIFDSNDDGVDDTSLYFPRWDKRHSFTIVGNLDWRGEYGLIKDMDFSLLTSFAFSTSTGLPYTRVLGIEKKHGNRMVDEYFKIFGDKNGERYPLYSRLDVTLLRGTHRFKYLDLTWYYQIINFFNHENVYLYQFDYHEEEGGAVPATRETTAQLPLIPIFIGFELEF